MQCAPGWPGEAGANRGCLKPGMDGVRNALRAPLVSAVRPGRSAPATRARGREVEQLGGLQAVLAVLAERVPVSSRGSKPRAAGSCFRRHWGANAKTAKNNVNTGRFRHFAWCGTAGSGSRCGTDCDAVGRLETRGVAIAWKRNSPSFAFTPLYLAGPLVTRERDETSSRQGGK